MKNERFITEKILYASLFIILVPAIVWLWASFTEDVVSLPPVHSKSAGWVLMAAGGLLMLWAVIDLIRYGKGLPMNAYPPPLLVKRGTYRLMRHPIYSGFGVLLAGYFIFKGSASGLWMVTPLVILAMSAESV